MTVGASGPDDGDRGGGESPRGTRDRLVEAARELFWRKGYHRTSVAEILERAEANTGSLYHFFPTKQDLLLAVLDWYLENLEAELVRPARERAEDPIEAVFAILEGYREALLATGLAFGCPIGNLALEFSEPDPVVREKLAANFRKWAEAVEACLREAGERLPADLDRRALSRFVLSTMEGGVMQARTHRRIEAFDDSVDQLRRYLSLLEETGAGRPDPRSFTNQGG